MTSAFLFSRVFAAVMRNKTVSELASGRKAELKRHLTTVSELCFSNEFDIYEEKKG